MLVCWLLISDIGHWIVSLFLLTPDSNLWRLISTLWTVVSAFVICMVSTFWVIRQYELSKDVSQEDSTPNLSDIPSWSAGSGYSNSISRSDANNSIPSSAQYSPSLGHGSVSPTPSTRSPTPMSSTASPPMSPVTSPTMSPRTSLPSFSPKSSNSVNSPRRSRNRRLSLQDTFRLKNGFDYFANHLVREFSVENLFFLFEAMQIKNECIQNKLRFYSVHVS